jgi:hypothetical protein
MTDGNFNSSAAFPDSNNEFGHSMQYNLNANENNELFEVQIQANRNRIAYLEHRIEEQDYERWCRYGGGHEQHCHQNNSQGPWFSPSAGYGPEQLQSGPYSHFCLRNRLGCNSGQSCGFNGMQGCWNMNPGRFENGHNLPGLQCCNGARFSGRHTQFVSDWDSILNGRGRYSTSGNGM